MRTLGVLLAVTLGSLSVPAVADAVLATAAFDAPLATPLWFRAVADESRLFRVHVEGPGTVAVRAASQGALQLHVFPHVGGALVAHPEGFDPVPSPLKVRQLGPGDWLVAIDPAVRGAVTAEFRGVPGRDMAFAAGTWTCPFDPTGRCLP